MSVLSDKDIFHRAINCPSIPAMVEKALGITPWNSAHLQPASYELTLSAKFLVFSHNLEVIDPLAEMDYTTEIDLDKDDSDYFVLHPGEFVLGSTVERFRFPADLVGMINGKSSLGRLGLQVHATAGFFDPGFWGTATLEMSNVSRLPMRLWPGMLIAQMIFMETFQATSRPYGSKDLHSRYQGQDGPTPSRYSRLVAVVEEDE